MTNAAPQPTGELSLRTVAMPADTNPAGDIFGGWLAVDLVRTYLAADFSTDGDCRCRVRKLMDMERALGRGLPNDAVGD